MNIALLAQGSLVSKREATWLTLTGLAKEYVKHGHRAFICATKKQGLPEVEDIDNIKVYRINNGIFRIRKTLKFIENKEKINFDVVHGFSSSPLAVLNTYYSGKVKKIHTLKSLSKFSYFRKFWRLLSLVDVITVSTNNLKNVLIASGCAESKLKIVKSNIDTSKFKPRNKNQLKSKYGLSNKKVILYYGAMNVRKGVDYLIQALPLLVKNNPGIFCILAMRSTGQDTKRKYEQMLIDHSVQDFAKIIMDEIPIEEFVGMADAVVLPYSTLIGTEENPSCLLEAMASKTTVVTTSLPELKEHFENLVLMAKPGDSISLAEKITEGLNQNTQRLEAAFKKSGEFDVRVIAKQFLELYL